MGRGGETDTGLALSQRPELTTEQLRNELQRLANRLDLDAYEVGGCLRDEYSGRPVKDIDICVCGKTYDELESLLREELARLGQRGGITPLETTRRTGLFDEAGKEITETNLVGLRFYPNWGPKEGFEFALARTEISLGDGGHKDFAIVPDATLTIEQDLERRDFTINAIARSLRNGRIYDPYNGISDIEAGLIRTVTEDSFRDDSLRILRVFPRMAKDGFAPAPETLEQMRRYAPLLAQQSAERIKEELEKTLSGQHAAKALRLARDLGLLQSAEVLPEFAACVGYDQQSKYHGLSCDEHILLAVERACVFDAPLPVRWAALLHDIGKPVMGWEGKDGHRHFYGNPGDRDQTKLRVRELRTRVEELESERPETKKELHEHKLALTAAREELEAVRSGRIAITAQGDEIDGRGHELVGSDLAVQALNRLRCDNDTTAYVQLLVEEHMYNDDDEPTERSARRFLARIAGRANRRGIDPRSFADDLLMLRRCDRAAKYAGELQEGWDAELAYFEGLVEQAKSTPILVKELPVNGQDAQSFGFRGPEIGELLKGLLKEVVADPKKGKREVLLKRIVLRALREKRLGVGANEAITLGLSNREIGQALDQLAERLTVDPDLDPARLSAQLADIAQTIAAS